MQAFLSFVPDVATLQRGFAAFVVLLDNGLPTTPSRIRLRRSGHQMLHKKVRMEKKVYVSMLSSFWNEEIAEKDSGFTVKQ